MHFSHYKESLLSVHIIMLDLCYITTLIDGRITCIKRILKLTHQDQQAE
jgi:hypothetical protein